MTWVDWLYITAAVLAGVAIMLAVSTMRLARKVTREADRLRNLLQ